MPAQESDAPEPSRHDPWRQRIGKHVAALGVVGALMVALPLVQVLRFHGAEADTLAATRSRFDPMARAFDLQRGLLAHRDAAGLVLGGRSAVEPERRLRQDEVDQRVATLDVALAGGPWERARHEADALRDDWGGLVRQVAAHGLSTGESDQAHRLLVEQTLQVIDLVADTGVPHAAAADAPALQPALAVAQALPRLTWQLAQLTPAAGSETWQRELAAAEARLARTLGLLDAALAAPRSDAMPALADAAAGAGAAADRYFHLLRAGAAPADLAQALQATTAAQHALFAGVQAAAGALLDSHEQQARVRLQRLLAALAAGALTALLLVIGMARRGPPGPASPPASVDGDDDVATAPPRQQAGQLLDRLRTGRQRTESEAPTTLSGTP